MIVDTMIGIDTERSATQEGLSMPALNEDHLPQLAQYTLS